MRDGLVREGFVTVLGEHGDEDVSHNLHLGTVRRSNLNEDIPGIQRNLGMVTIDDWR